MPATVKLEAHDEIWKENRNVHDSVISTVAPTVTVKLEEQDQTSSVASGGRGGLPLLSSSSQNRTTRQVESDEASFQPKIGASQLSEVGHKVTKDALRGQTQRRPRMVRYQTNESSRLQEQAEMMSSLRAQVRALERSERRLKTRLEEEKESRKDIKSDLQSAYYQASVLEEKLDRERATRRGVVKELERYRGWWLNEYYCLKVTLQHIVDPDDGVVAMQESSHARFMVHVASQSNLA